MASYPYNAIFIDAVNKEIKEVQIKRFDDIYTLLGCRSFECPIVYPNNDTLYLDEDGINQEVGFEIKGGHYTYTGNGLIIGANNDGRSINAKHTVEQVKRMVKFAKFIG